MRLFGLVILACLVGCEGGRKGPHGAPTDPSDDPPANLYPDAGFSSGADAAAAADGAVLPDAGGAADATVTTDAGVAGDAEPAFDAALPPDSGGGGGGGGPTGLEGFCTRYFECGGSWYQSVDDCMTQSLDYWGSCQARIDALDTFSDCMIEVPCTDYQPDAYDPNQTVCAPEWQALQATSC